MKGINERIENAGRFFDRGNNRKFLNGILTGTILALSYPQLDKITEYKIPPAAEVREQKREMEDYKGRKDDIFSLEDIADDSLKVAVTSHYNEIGENDVAKVVNKINRSFKNLFDKFSKEYDLDVMLMKGLTYQESTVNPREISDKGAVGLGQIMPRSVNDIIRYVRNKDTRTELRREMRRNIKDKLMIPRYNLELSAAYLSALIERYDDNIILGLAAYNMGPTAVDKLLRAKKLKPNEATYYKILDSLSLETREFIPKVFSKAVRMREGYTSEKDKNLVYRE